MRKLRAPLIAATIGALLAPQGVLAKTFTVDVGAPGKLPAHLDLSAFFPSALTVHAGDAVRFHINGLHNIAYLPPGMMVPAVAVPEADARVGEVRDAAGTPFWFDSAPRLEVNPLIAFPAGGGTLDSASYANSGLPSRSRLTGTYLLRFPRVGTFRLHCLIHRAMSMLVHVVPRARAIPSPAQVKSRAHAQLQAALRLARRLERFTPPPRLTVLAGHDAGPVAWMRFFPQRLRIRVEQTVTFRIDSMMDPHTVTFGPEAYTGEIERTLIEPQPTAGGPPELLFNPLGVYPSEPPHAPLIYTGANHGNGFLGSGMLDTDPHTRNPDRVRITFTRPGTYHFECVIHPDMDGTITVTP